MFINKKQQKYFSSKTEVFIFHFFLFYYKEHTEACNTHTHRPKISCSCRSDQIRYELYQFTDNYNLLKV